MTEDEKILKKAEKARNYLIGQVLKQLKAEKKIADPLMVGDILERVLQSTFKEMEQKRVSESKNTSSF